MLKSTPETPLSGTVSRPAAGWGAGDLPCWPGTVLQYRTIEGSRMIAVLTDYSLWRVQCINDRGEVLQWAWTPAALAGNLWETGSFEIIPAP